MDGLRSLEVRGFDLGTLEGCGLHLADAQADLCRLLSIHLQCTTRGVVETLPTSKEVNHGGCGIHLANEH